MSRRPPTVPPDHALVMTPPSTARPEGSRLFAAAIASAVASVLFGASVVATRYVVGQTQPVSLAFLRYGIATLCLLPIVARLRTTPIARRDLFGIGALGALFFGLFPWCFSAALTYSPSARVAIEAAAGPMVTLIISRLRGYDHITPTKLVGQILAFGGLYLALRSPSGAQIDPSQVWKGDALMVIVVLCGAIYNVFSRPYLKRYASLQVTLYSMAAGALVLAPIAASKGLFNTVPHFSMTGWFAVLYLGSMGGALGFGLWIWALEHSSPSRVAVFLTLNPITAIVLGATLLHEPITALFVIGLCGVLAGILLTNFRPRSDTAELFVVAGE